MPQDDSQNQGLQSQDNSIQARLERFWTAKNKWQEINGGCRISEDIDATLRELRDSSYPYYERLPEMIRNSLVHYDRLERPIEQIWQEKLSEGANYVGVLNGVFHFFKDEDELPMDNKDLQITTLPPLLQLREAEQEGAKRNWLNFKLTKFAQEKDELFATDAGGNTLKTEGLSEGDVSEVEDDENDKGEVYVDPNDTSLYL